MKANERIPDVYDASRGMYYRISSMGHIESRPTGGTWSMFSTSFQASKTDPVASLINYLRQYGISVADTCDTCGYPKNDPRCNCHLMTD